MNYKYKSFRYRIYPTKEQEIILNQWLGEARSLYNFLLDQKIEAYKKTGNNLNFYNLNKMIPTWVKQRPWASLPSYARSNKAIDVIDSFKRFFSKQNQFPKFKSKFSDYTGIRIDRTFTGHKPKRYWNIKYSNKGIKIPNMKESIKWIYSRPCEGTIKFVTIKKTPSNQWYAILCCEIIDKEAFWIPKPIKEENIIGIDVGIKSFIHTSDDEVVEGLKFQKEQNKIKKLQRRLSKKKRGSKNYQKARIKLARCHQKIANQRQAIHYQTAAKLSKDYEVAVVEDLAISNMNKNKRLAKSLMDQGIGNFIVHLSNKMETKKVSRFFPSSKLCSCCGTKKPKLSLSERTYKCDNCGNEIDRDLNAAINIEQEGIRLLGNRVI